ncbi:ketoacyl-ACP synthase III [Anaerovibrio lipolyticus]|uniref:ketoacyl-ACP synthase III n=1 Tax=Anaerovibrio lipolyticus TaxID=82374 RepID=UPI000487AD63|nr:ketoacyl-ACP synthase III [Anaerovibrio lipolyticus]
MQGKIAGIHVESLATTVMRQRIPVEERCVNLLPEKKIKRLANGTGFAAFSIAPDGVCASDFCVHAAKKLMEVGALHPEDIGAVIFVTQTPDYTIPATSHIIQDRLGLPKTLLAFDVNQSCAGFVYGIYIAASLLSNLGKKVLLCFGDTTSRKAFPGELTFMSIIGDGGGVAVVEKRKSSSECLYSFHTYGERYQAIIEVRGGERKKKNYGIDGLMVQEKENYSKMDGMGVMDFTLNEVPDDINSLFRFANITRDDVEIALFHQANRMIVENLAVKLGLPIERVPFRCGMIGNTDMASIPVCITELKRLGEWKPYHKVLLSGFGAGLAVASMLIDFSDMMVMETSYL